MNIFKKTEALQLTECNCCGCYHPKGFRGDCRDDNNRYPTNDPNDKPTPRLNMPPRNQWQVSDSGVVAFDGVGLA